MYSSSLFLPRIVPPCAKWSFKNTCFRERGRQLPGTSAFQAVLGRERRSAAQAPDTRFPALTFRSRFPGRGSFPAPLFPFLPAPFPFYKIKTRGQSRGNASISLPPGQPRLWRKRKATAGPRLLPRGQGPSPACLGTTHRGHPPRVIQILYRFAPNLSSRKVQAFPDIPSLGPALQVYSSPRRPFPGAAGVSERPGKIFWKSSLWVLKSILK